MFLHSISNYDISRFKVKEIKKFCMYKHWLCSNYINMMNFTHLLTEEYSKTTLTRQLILITLCFSERSSNVSIIFQVFSGKASHASSENEIVTEHSRYGNIVTRRQNQGLRFKNWWSNILLNSESAVWWCSIIILDQICLEDTYFRDLDVTEA